MGHDVLGGDPVRLAAFELDAVEYTFHRGLPYPAFEDGAPETLDPQRTHIRLGS
jgi:hypothetical protein